MSTYPEIVAQLRALATAAIPLPSTRIDWSAFGAPGVDEVDPVPLNPSEGIWARVALVGEAPFGGGWGYTEYTGSLVVELRCEGLFDQEASGLGTVAGQVRDALHYATTAPTGGAMDCEFQPATVVTVDRQTAETRHQLNVIATYSRVSFGIETGTEVELPVNYTLAGHALIAGMAVRPNGAGGWAAVAATDPALPATAYVYSVSGSRVSLRFNGSVKRTHGLGSSGALYLSQSTAGAVTTTEPSSGMRQRLGEILSADELILSIDPPEVL